MQKLEVGFSILIVNKNKSKQKSLSKKSFAEINFFCRDLFSFTNNIKHFFHIPEQVGD